MTCVLKLSIGVSSHLIQLEVLFLTLSLSLHIFLHMLLIHFLVRKQDDRSV